jgi:hypothetical protein
MVRQVRFLVSVEEIADGAGKAGPRRRAGSGRSEDRGDAPASHRSEEEKG